MKNIFFKYIVPGFIALSLIGHFYRDNIKGAPECDSGATMQVLKRTPHMGEINPSYGTPVAKGKSASKESQTCTVPLSYTDYNDGMHMDMVDFTVKWKDSKKKQVVVTRLNRY